MGALSESAILARRSGARHQFGLGTALVGAWFPRPEGGSWVWGFWSGAPRPHSRAALRDLASGTGMGGSSCV